MMIDVLAAVFEANLVTITLSVFLSSSFENEIHHLYFDWLQVIIMSFDFA